MSRLKTLLLLPCLMAVAVAAVWLIGSAAMRRPDADPAALMTGAVFPYLREGARFDLEEAYPHAWEIARFVSSSEELTPRERRLLYEYDARYAEADDQPLLLLWQGQGLAAVVPLPADANGYPRFVDAMGSGSFALGREEARFACAFMPNESGRGGYYECRAVSGGEV